MALVNWLKVLRVLQRAEEVKKTLDYCLTQKERNACDCREGELCQRALAIATNLSDNAIKNVLFRLEHYAGEEFFPFEIRVKAGGGNFPRKFIRLRRD